MNGIFTAVEQKMIEELMKKGIGVKKKYYDKKAYLKELIYSIYAANH